MEKYQSYMLIFFMLFALFVLFVLDPWYERKMKKKDDTINQKDSDLDKKDSELHEKDSKIKQLEDELNKRKFYQTSFLTDRESAFLRMFTSAPILREEFNIHPQVAMSAFLETYSDEDRKDFNFRRVDFLICNKRSQKIYCVIELDGKEHANKQMDDLERDKMLEAAGIKTIRIKNDAFPTPEQLKQRIISLQR